MSQRFVRILGGSTSALLFAATLSTFAKGDAVDLGCGAGSTVCRAPVSLGPVRTAPVNPVPACAGFGPTDLARICSAAAPAGAELACRRNLDAASFCAASPAGATSRVPRWNSQGDSTLFNVPVANVSRAPRPVAASTAGRGFRFKASDRGGFRSSTLGPLLELMSAGGAANASGPVLMSEIATPRGLASAGAGAGAEDVVLSCSEYVYKRFYDYEQLVMAARAQLPNWRDAWFELAPLQHAGGVLRGYTSAASLPFANAIAAPLAGTAAAATNTLLMPAQPNDVALRALSRNPMFATMPAGVAARLGGAQTAIAQALAAGQAPLWSRASRDTADPIFSEWVAHVSAMGYADANFGFELPSDEAKASFTGRAARYGEKLVAEVQMQQELFCVEHPKFASCSDSGRDVIAALARRYAHRNDAPGPIPELLGPLDDPRFGLDPLRVRGRVHELAIVGRVLSDPEMRSAPFGATTTRANFLAVADRVRLRVIGAAASSTPVVTAPKPTTLSLSLAARSKPILTIPTTPTVTTTPLLSFSKLNAGSLATITSAQASKLANISVADARTLDRTVLMSLPTDSLVRLAKDPALAAIIAAEVNLAALQARRDALQKGIDELDASLSEMLVREWTSDDRHGCLEVRPSIQAGTLAPSLAPNRCDFSPEISLRRMMNLFVTAEEDEFRKCVKATGDSFEIGARMMFDPSLRASGTFDVDAFVDRLKWTSVRLPNGGSMRLPNFANSGLFDASLQKKKFYPTGWRGPFFCGLGVRPDTVSAANAKSLVTDCSLGLGFQPPGISVPSVRGAMPSLFAGFGGNIPRFANVLTFADFVNHVDLPDAWGEFQVGAIKASLAGLRAELSNLPTIDAKLPEIGFSLNSAVINDLSCGTLVTSSTQDALRGFVNGLKLGEEKSDGETYGDPDWFAASWGYRWSWGVWPEMRRPVDLDNANAAADGGNACLNPAALVAGFGGQAIATAHADFTAFFGLLRANVLTALVSVSARVSPQGSAEAKDAREKGATIGGIPEGVSATAQLEVLGQSLVGTPSGPSLSGFVVDLSLGDKSVDSPKVYVPVGPFTLEFAGSAVIETGMKQGLRFPPPTVAALPTNEDELTRPLGIKFSAEAYVEPYVNVDAVGSASLSVGIGSAGGRVSVRVLGLSVPAGMTASLAPETGLVAISESASVKLATLKGKVEAFATVGIDPFSKSWYWSLFDWDGYERTIPLFNREETSVDLGKLMKRLAAPKNFGLESLD